MVCVNAPLMRSRYRARRRATSASSEALAVVRAARNRIGDERNRPSVRRNAVGRLRRMVTESGQRRFFFVHVMKTGGTSFVFQLLRNFAPDEVYPDVALDRRSPTDAEPYASLTALERL